MKIKTDFITNSSSTSFTFIFKGDHLDLYKALWARPDLFNICFDAGWGGNANLYTCNVDEVIRSIDETIKANPNDSWIQLDIKKIDEKIEELRSTIEDTNWNEGKTTEALQEWEKEYVKEKTAELEKVKVAKKKGLTSYLQIGFGDNHGEVCGGNVGTAMDYEGRYISVDDDDLVIFTEQNR